VLRPCRDPACALDPQYNGKERPIEEIKGRYYSVARQLFVGREGGEDSIANQTLVKHPFNADHERHGLRPPACLSMLFVGSVCLSVTLCCRHSEPNFPARAQVAVRLVTRLSVRRAAVRLAARAPAPLPELSDSASSLSVCLSVCRCIHSEHKRAAEMLIKSVWLSVRRERKRAVEMLLRRTAQEDAEDAVLLEEARLIEAARRAEAAARRPPSGPAGAVGTERLSVWTGSLPWGWGEGPRLAFLSLGGLGVGVPSSICGPPVCLPVQRADFHCTGAHSQPTRLSVCLSVCLSVQRAVFPCAGPHSRSSVRPSNGSVALARV
jgi:hypothetical protein